MKHAVRLVRILPSVSALLIGLLPLPGLTAAEAPPLWMPASAAETAGSRTVFKSLPAGRGAVHRLSLAGLRGELAKAPREGAEGRPFMVHPNPLLLPLPTPDGKIEWFQIEESSVMEPGLEAKFPEIRTYRGQGVSEPAATARIDLTPLGFHAQVLSPARGTWLVDPCAQPATDLYLSHGKSEHFRLPSERFKCQTWPAELRGLQKKALPTPPRSATAPQPQSLSGPTLRTYRLAVGASGEYTAAVGGGTVSGGQAAIVTAINRVTGIYEQELAIRFVLVANNQLLVYTNPATDGYTNGDAFAMAAEHQSKADTIIGSANYDVGHVFGTGTGGVGVPGVCEAGYKAAGATGTPNPTGDAFWVDFVAHELGHQFGANHTWNGDGGSCDADTWWGPTAYEPGSGSTIMSYAGLCNTDFQANVSPYFHIISLFEIHDSITNGLATCGTQTSTGNAGPTASAGPNYTIPARTPFVLTGSGSDPNGDALTYCWEEFDRGPRQLVLGGPDNGSSPLVRSYPPTTNPKRYIPRLADLLTNTADPAELLPTLSRTMRFRLTVRDNRSGGGGVEYDETALTVVAAAGPFAATSPAPGVTWFAGSTQTVTWDVAGTNANGINASHVDIRLSTDGGYTFPTLLVSLVPNNGSCQITVPAVLTGQARIKIEPTSNIFFAVTPGDFSITLRAPTVVIEAPVHNSAVKQLPAVSGVANDPNGLPILFNEVQLSIYNDDREEFWTGSAWTTNPTLLSASINGDGTWAFSAMPMGPFIRDGLHIITAQVTNSAGIPSQFIPGVTRVEPRVDNVPPVLTITSPAHNSTIASLAALFGTAEDDSGLGAVNFYLLREGDNKYWNGSTWVPSSANPPALPANVSGNNFTLLSGLPAAGSNASTNLTNGLYQLIAVGLDRAGNQSQTISSFLVEFTYVWTGATLRDSDPNNNSHDWSTAANWSPSGVPGENDFVSIGNGDTITSSVARTVRGLQLGSGTLSAFPLTITGPPGRSRWTGGIITGTLTVPFAAGLEIDTTNGPGLHGGTLANAGTVTVTGSTNSRLNGTDATIENTGTFQFARDGAIFQNVGTTPTFFNRPNAVLRKSAGTGESEFGNFRFTNLSGAMEAASGVLSFPGVLVTLNGFNAINGAGTVRFLGSYIAASGLLIVSGNAEILTGCTVVATPLELEILSTAHLRMLGGDLTGQVVVRPGSKLEIDSSNFPGFANLVLDNDGTIAVTGTGVVRGTDTLIRNNSAGRFEFNRTGIIFQNIGTTPVFRNDGTIACTSTSGQTDFGNFTLEGAASGRYTIAGGTFRIGSGVTLAGGSTFSGAGQLLLASGAATISGALHVNCEAEFPNGSGITLNAVTFHVQSGRHLRQTGGVLSGTVNLPPGGRFEVDTTNTPSWNGLSFHNQGTLFILGDPVTGRLNGTSTLLTNALGGILEFARSGTIFQNVGTTPTVVNAGTLLKSDSAGLTAFGNWDLSSSANANYLLNGNVLLFTSSLTFQNGTTFNGDGTVRLLSGAVTINGLLTAACRLEIPGGTITLNMATLAASGSGRLLVSGGVLTGTGTLPGGSKLELDTTSDISWNNLTLTNHGTITIAGDAVNGRLYGTSTTLTNETGGRVEMARAGTIFVNVGTTPVLVQRGTLAKTTGGLTTFGNWRLSGADNAVYSHNGGSLLWNGEVSLGAGTQFTGSGLVRLESGQLTVNGRLNLAVPTQLNAGVLVAANAAEIATLPGGSFTWTAGAMTGSVGVPPGTAWTLDTTFDLDLSNSVLGNHGTITLTGSPASGSLRGSNTVIHNHSDGRLDIARDGLAFTNTATPPQINNSGVIAKTAGTGLTEFGTFVLVHGTGAQLQAASGVLRLTGTASFAHDSQFSGAGTIRLLSGALTLSGRLLVDANTELVGGGLNCGVSGDSQIFNPSGKQFLWSGGYIIGTLTIPVGCRLDCETTNDLAIGNTTFLNYGRLVVSGSSASGTIRGSDSALLNFPSGSLEFARDGQIFTNVGTTPIVTNAGTISKTGGSGQTDFGTFRLINQGPLSVPAGQTLRFTNTIDLQAGTNAVGGGRVLLETGAATLSGATAVGSSTTLELAGAMNGATNGGGQPLGSLAGPGTFRWSAGTLTGYVPLLAGSNAVFDTTNGGLGFYGTMTLAGTATLTGSNSLVGSSSLFSILSGGLLHLPVPINVVNVGTVPQIQNAGTVRLASSTTLNTSWSYAQTASGVLEFQIAGSGAGQFSKVQVVGSAAVNGQLKVTRLNGYSPALGTQFPIMTFFSATGSFTSASGLGLHNGLKLSPIVTATSVTLDTVVSAFGNWQASVFGPNAGNPAIAGPYASPAGDGIPNVLKYAFGLNPLVDGSAKLPRAAITRDPNTNLPHLGLSFRRIIGAADPIYVPRVSSSLSGAWDESGAQVEQMGTPSANGDGTETVVFRLRTPVAPGEHRFMDLLVDFE